MTTEDEIRRVPHPEAHEPMRYNPRIPLGCDQQGRYPQAAEPCVDLDELGVKLPPQEPWWPYILGAVVGLLALVLVFAPLGV
jgi:hypothetical protein